MEIVYSIIGCSRIRKHKEYNLYVSSPWWGSLIKMQIPGPSLPSALPSDSKLWEEAQECAQKSAFLTSNMMGKVSRARIEKL